MFSSVHKIEVGVITAWAGGLGNIPPGWNLCDGTNGTPDLRDNFIVGSGSAFVPDDSGGAFNHTHDFTGDGHGHTIPAGTALSTAFQVDPPVTPNNAVGTTNPDSNVPPFYALAYIQYLG